MNTITITWIGLPLLLGFVIYLFPKLGAYLSLATVCLSIVYGVWILISQTSFDLQVLDNFGVILKIDQLSGYFILNNALITLAVILYCWHTEKTGFFYTQLTIVHTSVNAVFICADLLSLYVALEVIGIVVFLLIAYPRNDRSIWVALRYLFVGNVAMLFYLVGAILVYKTNYSFALAGINNAPPEALALMIMALLSKGGVFISGLWLPLSHSEAETSVATISGVVVKAGVFPLLRFAEVSDGVGDILRIFGVATALIGSVYAILDQDTKRTLALSTIAQVGWIIAAPAVGGFYTLSHGLAKASAFLTAGVLPSRDFRELERQKINTRLSIVLTIASLSMMGFPLLAGFGAKNLTFNNLLPWQIVIMNIAAVCTAIVYAKFIFLPFGGKQEVRPTFWSGVIVLTLGLFLGNGFYLEAYTIANLSKALIIILAGCLAYGLIFRKINITLNRVLEEFDHLIGFMSLMLILIFWMVLKV
ncbi:MAG: cation:proton antiporter [Gloeocapsa sp. DLM2.Bin57]|nr:MAG: cation:proton antiporter [Gloeocapsa sp. DLM2.Bin57]